MASKKKLTGAALAESKVLKKQLPDSAIPTYSLAVNDGFADPNAVSPDRGVAYPDAPENRQAEQGIARHLIKQFQPESLQKWALGLVASKGGGKKGAAEAARSLLAMDTPSPTEAQHKAMVRKLAEWRQGKYQHAAGGNAHRVGLLRLSQAKSLVIGVRGLWLIEDEEKYRVFNSDPREPHHVTEAIKVLRADGAGFIETVIAIAAEYAQPYAPELLQTHELRLEVSA